MAERSGTNELSGSTHREHELLESLGKYRIKKKLGAGGMGTVFLAVDEKLNRTVALKVLPKDRAENPTLVKRFKSEAKAAAQLEHKNIVRVYETGEIDGFLYIALEYVDGVDVHELVVKRDIIPVKRSIDIVRQVALALEHASAKNIVHRDIKPANLMIRRDGTVKLADMGLARAIDNSLETGITRAGMTVGTVDYMAPEQARSSQAADVRSDIYSLGCTWYHMLTGAPPFAEGGMTAKLQSHATGKRPDPRSQNPAIPEAVIAVLHRMMACKPNDRYQTPAELLEDLELLTKRSSNINTEVLEALAGESDTSGFRETRGTSSSGTLPVLPPKDEYKPVDLTKGGKLNLDVMRYVLPALLVIGVIGILIWATRQGGDALSGGATTSKASNPYRDRDVESPIPDKIEGGAHAGPTATDPATNLLEGLSAPEDSGPTTVVAVPFPGAEDSRTTSDGVRLLPTWVNYFRTPPKADRQSIVVTREPSSAVQYRHLNQAFDALRETGGVIQLDGDGPFTLKPASLNTDGEVRLTATEGSTPVVSLDTGGLGGGQDAFLVVHTARLVIDHVHFVMVDPPHDLAILQVEEGDVSLQNCSFTVRDQTVNTTTAISLKSLPRRRGAGPELKEPTGRCLLENVIFQGDRLSAVELRGNACELVAGNCLISSGDAPAIVLSEGGARGAGADAEQPERQVRLLASTVTSAQSILKFVADAGGTQSAPCKVVTRKSLLASTSPTGLSDTSTMVSLDDWTENTTDIGRSRASGVEWSSENSHFLGWPTLVTMAVGDGQSMMKVVDADEWRRFWDKPLESDTVLSEPLSGGQQLDQDRMSLVAIANAIADDVQSRGGQAGTGFRTGDLSQLPLGLIDHVVEVINMPGEPEWLGAGMPLNVPPIIRDLRRKTDVSRLLRSNVCVDGTHMIFTGSGLHEITPVIVEDKSIRVEFRSSDGSPLILQVEPDRSSEAASEAAITVRNGTLDLIGAQIKMPASTSDKQPRWLFDLADASLSLRGCTIEGPSTASATHTGLVKFSPLDASAGTLPRGVLVEDSFLISPGSVFSGNVGWDSLVLRNNVFASQSDILNVTLDESGLGRRPVVVLDHCTCSAAESAFRFTGEGILDHNLPSLRMFVDDNLFLGSVTGWKTPSTVLARNNEQLTRTFVTWWGSGNAYASSLSHFVQLDDVGSDFRDQWTSEWGAGHEINALTSATDVLFEAAFPVWTELQPQSFDLRSSAKASHSGLDRQGAGARWELVGANQSVESRHSTAAEGGNSPVSPTVPKKRRSGF